MNKEANQQGFKQLEKIAEVMETVEPGSAEYKQLSREYRQILESTGITTNGKVENGKYELPADKIKQSKQACYAKIIKALDDLDVWTEELKKIHISSMGHIAFFYNENHNGIPMEMQFKIPDHFYSLYSGYKATKNRISLVSVKQLCGYGSIEYGILRFTLDFLRGKERKEFVEKYDRPYNEKIKSSKQ